MTEFDQLWDGLRRVRVVEFVTQGTVATGWSGSGIGVVVVESPSPTVLMFRESGTWRPTGGHELRFRNVYRWSRLDECVRLEHLRFGDDNPVYLFDLVPDPDGVWSSVAPHLCREDTYTAQLRGEKQALLLEWKVVGPKKGEAIRYQYSSFPFHSGWRGG